MFVKVILSVLFLFLVSCVTAPIPEGSSPAVAEKPSEEILINHNYYVVSYNQKHLLANYVSYSISKSQLIGPGKRKDNFKTDPELKARKIPALNGKAFAKTGYQRGHLAPAADFKRSQEAMDATFYMSNMVPQVGQFNKDAWGALESRIRNWLCHEEKLTIVTGPILEDQLPRLPSGASVPKKLFKVVSDETAPVKAICFVYSQDDVADVYRERAMSVKKCEELVGYVLPVAHSKMSYDLSLWKSAKCN